MLDYLDELPLAWSADAPDADAHQRSISNVYALEAVAAVEEHGAEGFHEEQSELQQELRRLDAKVQLLLDMVARLLQDAGRFPERHPVRVTVDYVDIAADAFSAAIGDTGLLALQLHPAIPAPLQLRGQLAETVEDAGGRWLRFRPDPPLAGAEHEALARHIFRHHRRSIAASRRGDGGS